MANAKDNLALIVTVLILVAAAVLGVVMLVNIGVAEVTWSRYAYLLTGIEAILFAAVGWLFGKEVHRQEAVTAEAKRTEAEGTAREAAAHAATEAEKGRGLAQAVINAATGQSPEGGEEAARVGGTSPSAMVGLAEQARSLYPDL